jgi:hypothetical protein
MKTIGTDRTPPALTINASIETILGQERYLEKITEALYANQISYADELVALSEPEFKSIVGRTTSQNVQRVKRRLNELGLSFKSVV